MSNPAIQHYPTKPYIVTLGRRVSRWRCRCVCGSFTSLYCFTEDSSRGQVDEHVIQEGRKLHDGE